MVYSELFSCDPGPGLLVLAGYFPVIIPYLDGTPLG